MVGRCANRGMANEARPGPPVRGRRWRLPRASKDYDAATNGGELRICREVATERDMLSACGTFYELPAENADGFAKIRPICSHDLRVTAFAR